MNMPFGVYDFFAHVASGTVAIAGFGLATKRWISPSVNTLEVLLFAIVAYTVGQLLAQVGSTLLESALVRRALGPPEIRLFERKAGTLAFVFPGFHEPLDAESVRRVTRRLEGEGASLEPGRAMFMYCWARARAEEDARKRLDSFLYLYGFSRNMAVALLGAALMLLGGPPEVDGIATTWIALGSAAAAVVLIYRYLKYFRLYTQEVFIRYADGSSPAVP
jgi:hypothetical protein